MSVSLLPNQVVLEFKYGVDLIDLLQCVDFYIKKNKGGVLKIVLCTKKDGIEWYNDITSFKETHMLFLQLHLKNIKPREVHQKSGIDEGELSIYCKLIIDTLNPFNEKPILKTRQVFLHGLYVEWLSQI